MITADTRSVRLAGLETERDAWRALAIEASSIEPVMKGIGMTQCAFCSAPAAPDYLPEHRAGCLVLRVRALEA